MATSDLCRIALQINNKILTRVFHYRHPFNWNDTIGRFTIVPNKFQLHGWLFVNIFLQPWVAIVNSIVVICCYSAKIYPNLNILQIIILLVQILLTLFSATIAFVFLKNPNDWALFLNRLLKFSMFSRRKLSIKNPRFLKNTLRKFETYSNSLYRKDGSLDLFGIFLVSVNIAWSFFNLTLPPFVFYFELDAPVHFFRIVLPSEWYTPLWSWILIFLVRIFIGTWSICEGINMFRSYLLYLFLIVKTYKDSLSALQKRSVSMETIKNYRSLAVLFVPINESLSILVTVSLGVVYWILQMTNSITILGLNVIDWKFYISIPFASLYAFLLTVVSWRMATMVDVESRRLKQKWRRGIEEYKQPWSMHRKVVLRRMIKSLRPISIMYGSLGKMKLRTMRAYFSALFLDTFQLCVVLKDRKIFV